MSADTWEVWGSTDPVEDLQPAEANVTRERAVKLVDELQAQGYTTAYAADITGDDDNPDTYYNGPTTVTVAGFESLLDLPSVKKFRTGEDGTLVAIDYQYDPHYPNLSGPLLHFQLPDGRVVVTVPDGEGGFQLAWKGGMEFTDGEVDGHAGVYEVQYTDAGQVDEGAVEVIHILHGEIVDAFNRLTRQFLVAACTNVGEALKAGGS